MTLRFFATYERLFWARVRKGDGDSCWEWTGKLMPNGYGVIRWFRRTTSPHRVSYGMAFGPPGEKLVCHRCDNRKCVRPGHLFLGTAADNIADMIAKGRNRPPRGELSGRTNLSNGDILRMRVLANDGVMQKELAVRYGISPKQVSVIVTGKQWAHVDGPRTRRRGPLAAP